MALKTLVIVCRRPVLFSAVIIMSVVSPDASLSTDTFTEGRESSNFEVPGALLPPPPNIFFRTLHDTANLTDLVGFAELSKFVKLPLKGLDEFRRCDLMQGKFGVGFNGVGALNELNIFLGLLF